ncbi:hypothetical protein O7632_30355 [Solwaraspora sp. WMMD406]|nr:hypothetical protein [Solwaraspora sp. WMMD406]MDG4768362.1 hypothetical protein [Solwaraspora sp. WMMD406]
MATPVVRRRRCRLSGSPAQFYTDFINTELSTLSADRTALSLLCGLPE